MAYTSLKLTVYQHQNAGNAADPNIGYWVCQQPNVPNSVPRAMAQATLTALGATVGQPYATLALAQAALQLVANYEAQQLALQTVDTAGSASTDTLVYGPVTT